MINTIIRQFEKKNQNKTDLRTSFGAFAGRVGLLSNLILFVGKLVIGLISGSVSIMADAINSLSDTVSSILTLVGFYISGKPADKEHPYGHERFEYISGMLVSLIITFVGFQFFLTSVDRILNPQSIIVTPIVLVILVLSIAIKLWQGFFYQGVAKKIDSNTLVAAGKDSFNDVFTTLAVLVSAAFESLTNIRIDGFVGFIIACYIIYSGLALIREFIDELMGLRPNQGEIDEMINFLENVPGIIGYHDLLIHQYGPSKTFASVHIEIDASWELTRAHEIIDEIEYLFRKQLGVELVCHVDPINLADKEQQLIKADLKQILKEISPALRVHDIRLINHDKKLILFDLVIPSKFEYSDEELKTNINAEIAKRLGTYKVKITFDHTYLL